MKNKPAIALVVPGGIGTGRANIGVPVIEQVTKMLAKEFSVTVFQFYKANDDYHIEGFDLVEIHSSSSLLRMIRFVIAFRKLHRLRKFQAVHAFWVLPSGFLAVVMGKIFGIKSIVSLQGGDAVAIPEIKYGQLLHLIPRKFALWTLHNVAILLSPAEYCIERLRDYGLRRQDARFVPLGIDPILFNFNPLPVKIPVKFLHIGNFNPVKDQQTLLKSFCLICKHIECELTIVGEGELEEKIKSIAIEYGISARIKFLAPLPYKRLPELYHDAHIMLHTSLSEGHPIVAEEAMSCGVLLCGTKVGLLYELEDCCITVETRDHEALASKVLEVLKDRNRIEVLRRNGRNWAESHSLAWTVKQFSELYHS